MNTVLAILNAVVNSLWQALAVTALVWLALKFAPRGTLSNNAATRHAIWWATLGVVLVLPVAPRLIQMTRPHPHPAVVATTKASKTATPAVTTEPFIVTVAPGRTATWPLAILAVWAAILLWRMFQIGRSYIYLCGVKRRSAISPVPLPSIARRADLLISPDIVSPMAVGFLRPAVVLPESLLAELSDPERDHVLLHESAHLAKYDDWSNLAMRIMGGVLALHPVAVWILRRIEREREMACDDWVVARTGSARPYAASLARLVELRQARRGEMLASGIFGSGSRIGDRIEMLLRRGRTFSPRASSGSVVASAVVLGGLMLVGSLAPRWIAFAQQSSRFTFEVASIKPNSSGESRVSGGFQPGGRYSVTNYTLRSLIAAAYVRPQVNPDFLTAGGPKWIDSERFDIDAKASGDFPSGPDGPSAPRRLMLQALLADRFKLRVHDETRPGPIYALTFAKNDKTTGPKLRSSSVDCPGVGCFARIGPGSLAITGTTMPRFVNLLPRFVDRLVIDSTGLTGRFDLELKWTPAPGEWVAPPLPGSAEPAADGPSIFTALQEQLGLKLQSRTGPVDMLVIDHAEKPDAN